MTSDDGDRLAALERSRPDALRLAELTSLAARLEPQFLRALRRAFMPRADVSVELDLWHSALIANRGAKAATLHADVQHRLIRRLGGDARRGEVLAATLGFFDAHPISVRVEIRLNALGWLDTIDDPHVAAEIAPWVVALRQDGEVATSTARWILQANGRWNVRVRRTPSAWGVLLAASALLGGRRLTSGATPAGLSPEHAMSVVPRTLAATRTLGISMTSRTLSFHESGHANAESIDVPSMSPQLMVLELPGEDARIIEAAPGQRIPLTRTRPVVLRSLLGDGWRIEPSVNGDDAKDADEQESQAWIRIFEDDDGEVSIEIGTHGHAPVVATWPPQPDGRDMPPDPDIGLRWPDGVDAERALRELDAATTIELRIAPHYARWSLEAWPRWGRKLLRAKPAGSAPDTPTRERRNTDGILLLQISGERTAPPAFGFLSTRFQRQAPAPSRFELGQADDYVGPGFGFGKTLSGCSFDILHLFDVGPPLTPLSDGNNLATIADTLGLDKARAEMVFVHGWTARALMRTGQDLDFVRAFFASGARIVVFCGEMGRPGLQSYERVLYDRLLDGEPLHRAHRDASGLMPIGRPSDADDSPRVWGRFDETLTLGRNRKRLLGQIMALKRSVTRVGVEASYSSGSPYMSRTAIRLGKNMCATSLAAAERIGATLAPDEGARPEEIEIHHTGISEDRHIAIFKQRFAEPRVGIPLASIVTPVGRTPAAILVATEGEILLVEVSVAPDNDANTDSHGEAAVDDSSRLIATTEPETWSDIDPRNFEGAPVLVAGACAGIVLDARQDVDGRVRLIVAPLAELKAALKDAWEARLPQLMARHSSWASGGSHQGEPFDVDGEDLSGVDLSTAAQGSQTSLERASFRGTRLQGANLSHLSLRDSTFSGAHLLSAKLTGADLEQAKFLRARMRLVEADGARLRGADLSHADLSNANLANADLRHTNLTGARLRSANLQGTRFSEHGLAGAVEAPELSLSDVMQDAVFEPRPDPSRTLRIFISGLARSIGLQRGVAERLQRFGLRVTVFEREISSKSLINARQMMAAYDGGVVVWEHDSLRNKEQLRLAELALELGLPILPIVINESALPQALRLIAHIRLPSEASDQQLFDRNPFRGLLVNFVSSVRARLNPGGSLAEGSAPPRDFLFCISHAEFDAADARILFDHLLALGAFADEIWLEAWPATTRPALDADVIAAAHSSRYFMPVLSRAVLLHPDADQVDDWLRIEEERLDGMHPSVLPVLIDPVLHAEDVLQSPLRAWAPLHSLRAPRGVLDQDSMEFVRRIVAQVRGR